MIVKRVDYQVPPYTQSIFPLVNGVPPQWDGYDPDTPPDRGQPTGGVTLGIPPGITTSRQWARFDPPKDPTLGDKTNMRPRSQGKINKGSIPDADYLAATGTTAGQYGTSLWMDAAEGLERWYRWQTVFTQDFFISLQLEKWAPTIFWFEHGDSSIGLGVPCLQFQVRRWPDATSPMRLMVQIVGGREAKVPKKVNANGVTVYDYSNPPTWAEGDDNFHWVETRREHYLEAGGAELRLGHKYDFMVGARYSGDPSLGWLQVYVDGVKTVDSRTSRNVKVDNVVRGESVPPNGGANLTVSNGVTHKLFMGQCLYKPREGPNTSGYDLTVSNPYDAVIWQTGLVIGETMNDLLPFADTGGDTGGTTDTSIVDGPEFVETWTLTGLATDSIVDGPEFVETWDLGAQYGLHDVTVYRRQNGVLKQLFGSKRTGGVLHGVTPTQFIDVGDDQ